MATSTTTGPLSTSGTTSDGGSSSTGTGSSSGAFIGEPDLPPSPVECDPHAEMPCPEGQKCSAAVDHPFIWIATPACFPVLGDKQHGEPCDLGDNATDGLDDCAAGLVCVDIYMKFDGVSPGVCVEFCDPPFYSEDGPYTCSVETEACFIPGCQLCQLTFCTPTCNPLAANCPADTICTLWGNAFFCRGGYQGVTLPGVGESCVDFYECAPGAACLATDMIANPSCDGVEACCTPYCDLNAPNTCPGKDFGETCQSVFPEPFDPVTEPWGLQYDNLGQCRL